MLQTVPSPVDSSVMFGGRTLLMSPAHFVREEQAHLIVTRTLSVRPPSSPRLSITADAEPMSPLIHSPKLPSLSLLTTPGNGGTGGASLSLLDFNFPKRTRVFASGVVVDLILRGPESGWRGVMKCKSGMLGTEETDRGVLGGIFGRDLDDTLGVEDMLGDDDRLVLGS